MIKNLPFSKIIKITFIGVTAIICFLFSQRISQNVASTYPYPYKLGKLDPKEVSRARKSDILIVGDSAGVILNDFIPIFKQSIQKYLKDPPKIYVWAKRGENLAITLKKVKALKKYKGLLIYHGGLDELDQKKIYANDIKKIKDNINLTQNKSLHSYIYTFPILSRLLYQPHARPVLTSNPKSIENHYSEKLSSEKILKILELLYEVYKWEVKELVTTLKKNDIDFWFIPQAYNLKVPPSRTCESTKDQNTQEQLSLASQLIIKDKTKEALSLIKPILDINKGHAKALYTIGNLFFKLGDFSKARKAYYQALIYDCNLRRSNPIFLKILMENIEKNDFIIINFNQLVTNYLGRNILFQGLRRPQNIYYEKLIDKMVLNFNQYLKRLQE